MEAAVILTAYKIEPRLRDHIRWNWQEYQRTGVDVYINVDREYPRLPAELHQLVYPYPVKVYSAPRMTNFILRRVCDMGRYSVIVRTDADIVFDGLLPWCLDVCHGHARVPLYHMAASYVDRATDYIEAPLAQGTVGMTAADWESVCGYNELMTGYTCDDGDLIQRLKGDGAVIDTTRAVKHIAHRQGSPQAESFTDQDKSKGVRTDHWNREIHPLRLKENLAIQHSVNWRDPNWGLIPYPEG